MKRDINYILRRGYLLTFFIALFGSVLCAGLLHSAEETKRDTSQAALEVKEGKVQPSSEVASSVPQASTAEEVKKTSADEKEVSLVGTETKASQAEAPEAVAEEAAIEPGNVTVNFKGADIRTVLAYISEVAGVDIVPAPDVKGIIDLRLTNKPWKTALDIIVRNYGFAYEQEGSVIRVITIDKLKQEELASQVFNLNYSKCKDVVNSIKDIVSERGKVSYDERTNTVLVRDIPTNLYKIGQIIERLDKKTAQVLIEARIIETLLDDQEKLGVDWNVKFSMSGAKRPTTLPFNQYYVPFFSKDKEMGRDGGTQAFFPQVLTAAPSTTTTQSGGQTVSTSAAEYPSTPQGTFAFPFAPTDNFTFGTLDFSQFSVILEMLKSRANTNIVSNPTIATLNNNEALINVGQTLNLPTYERNSSTGKMEITGYEAKDLGIILKVTPHVNENNEIVVDLEPMISDLIRYDTLDKASGVVAPVFSSRMAKTKVMIRDGDTIFIGGLIKENDVNVRRKLPFLGDLLGDIPYLGLVFTKKETVKQKTELVFFITVNLMVVGREIKDIPKPEKAYIPKYKATQDEESNVQRRRKRQGLF